MRLRPFQNYVLKTDDLAPFRSRIHAFYWLFVCIPFGLAILAAGCSGSTPPDSSATNLEPVPSLFTSVTKQAGLHTFRHVHGGFGDKWFPEIMGSGGGFIDYNGDGWLDILLVGGGNLPSRPPKDIPALSLYSNNGDGTFTNVTKKVGLADVYAYGFGVAAADYDNDGDEDILLTTLQENLLFRNDAGSFQEVGKKAGIGDVSRWSTSAMFFDANRDGHLDIYVANYVKWSPDLVLECIQAGARDYCNPRSYNGISDTYYRNNGDGTFTNQTTRAGFLKDINVLHAKGLGVSELDFNKDGWPDIYVANDGEQNFLYKNNGDGTFTETALRSGVALDRNGTPRAGMGVDVGVVDSTGKISIFVGNFSQEAVSVWRYQQEGFFIGRGSTSGIEFPTMNTLTFGLLLFDADLDTDLDLLLANGNVIEQIALLQEGVTFKERPQLFVNRGNGIFDEKKEQRGPLSNLMLARGLASGDIDRDGDRDVLITENNGPAHLWRNNHTKGHFLRVQLQGTESNRNGIGAQVHATVDGLTMERRVRGGSSYLSQSEKTVTFGLGQQRSVSVLEVTWPSGQVERFENVAPDQEVLLVEGSGKLVPVPLNQTVASQ